MSERLVTREIGRARRVGRALYAVVPKPIQVACGLKRGDRLLWQTDGVSMVIIKIPLDDIVRRAALAGRALDGEETE